MGDATVEVYLPVVVTVGPDGEYLGACVDFDGAPWMFVDSEANVWRGDDWTRDSDAETTAVELLSRLGDVEHCRCSAGTGVFNHPEAGVCEGSVIEET